MASPGCPSGWRADAREGVTVAFLVMTTADDRPLDDVPASLDPRSAQDPYVKPALVEDAGWDVMTGTPISPTT